MLGFPLESFSVCGPLCVSPFSPLPWPFSTCKGRITSVVVLLIVSTNAFVNIMSLLKRGSLVLIGRSGVVGRSIGQ